MQRVFTPSRGFKFWNLCPRGKKHGEAQWHRDHWKAMDARGGAWKHDQGSIAIRRQEGEKYRNSPKAHGWTEEYCRYLDYLATIGISHTAPWHHRHRYESTITLVCHDDDREAGPIRARRDSESTTKILTSLRQEQGRQHYSIPKNERMWQRTFVEEYRPELEWMSPDWKTSGRNLLPLHHPHKNGGTTNVRTLRWREHQDTQWRDHQWQDHHWRDHWWWKE